MHRRNLGYIGSKYSEEIKVGETYFDMNDVIKISRGTTKQDELFEYVEAPDYLKTRVKDIDEFDRNYDKSDDFDLSR